MGPLSAILSADRALVTLAETVQRLWQCQRVLRRWRTCACSERRGLCALVFWILALRQTKITSCHRMCISDAVLRGCQLASVQAGFNHFLGEHPDNRMNPNEILSSGIVYICMFLARRLILTCIVMRIPKKGLAELVCLDGQFADRSQKLGPRRELQLFGKSSRTLIVTMPLLK